ncbi:DUF1015 domain-containing protein [Chloroflexota bacterium]
MEIFPFRGVTYNQEKIGDLNQVVTQPYDKIDKSMQQAYHGRSDYNIVRIILGQEETGDTEQHNKYTRAADYFNSWLQEGILHQSDTPGIYAYHQTYQLADGVSGVRKSFVALGKLRDYSEGGIKPHENTLAGPKADRLNLMRATRANFGQIFMLYSDPEYEIEKILAPYVAKSADMNARAEYDVSHRMWFITDEEAIRKVREIMSGKEVFIADGHHRYETALNFRNEIRAKRMKSEGNESVDNCMMTFINIYDKALTILPTHRAVFGVDRSKIDSMKREVGNHFTIDEFKFSNDGEETRARKEFLRAMAEKGKHAHCFGLYIHGENSYRLLTLKDTAVLEKFDEGGHSQAYRELDVSILHSVLLRHFLGIDAKALAEERNVRYEKEAEEAIRKVKAGDFQMIFLVNPTRVEQVEKVAMRGERMAQKSTDFFPKLITGMVMNKLSIAD